MRQRVLLLLKLERFDEADRVLEPLRSSSDPVSREVVDRYPSLSFQHRMAAAHQKLRRGEAELAIGLLAGLTPPTQDEAGELAYSNAFARAQRAYQHLGDGDHARARELLREALAIAESAAKQHARSKELAAKLEKDLIDLEARA